MAMSEIETKFKISMLVKEYPEAGKRAKWFVVTDSKQYGERCFKAVSGIVYGKRSGLGNMSEGFPLAGLE